MERTDTPAGALDPVRVEVAWTAADYRAWVLATGGRFYGLVVLGVTAVALIVGRSTPWAARLLVAVLLDVVIVWLVLVVMPRSALTRNPAVVTYLPSADGLQIDSPGTTVTLAWPQIRSVLLRPGLVQFRRQPSSLCLPRRAVAEAELARVHTWAQAAGVPVWTVGRLG
jgi:hypothetical protein